MKERLRRRITIIGCGYVGTSLGLALRASPNAGRFEVVGHDREPLTARRAWKMGAFDKVAVTLSGALTGAAIVVLALPLAEVRQALIDVGVILRDEVGVLVTDTAPMKAPILSWAAEVLPTALPFVGGDPFFAPQEGRWSLARGVEMARADAFRDAHYAIVPQADVRPDAVQALAEMATLIGARPLLMDPLEHDRVRLLIDALPALMAAALVESTAGRPLWNEAGRVAGYSYATATAAAELEDAVSLRMMTLLEREPLLAEMDALLAVLRRLRESLAAGDAEMLEKALASAQRRRAEWARARHTGGELLIASSTATPDLFHRTMRALLGGLGPSADDEG